MDSSDFIPGAFPLERPQSPATSTTEMRPLSVPSRWTSLCSTTAEEHPLSWHQWEVPSELLHVRPNLNVPAKLLEILQWSLQRTSKEPSSEPRVIPGQRPSSATDRNSTSADSVSTATHDFSSNQKSAVEQDQDRTVKLSGCTNVASIASDATSCSSRSDSHEGKRVRLRHLRKELATATAKVTALKARHATEATTSSKLRKNPSPGRATPVLARESSEECASCFEDLPVSELTRLSCSHYYCARCLRILILTSIQAENTYPPKCCLTEIPPATIIIPLDKSQREQYKQKAAEYSIPANRRWYCPNTACTKWIPPITVRRLSNNVKCPHCSTKICQTCRGERHPANEDCPQDFGLEATLSAAELEGWKRCFRCRTMVERRDGCRHITCTCGAEFCYVCGSKWRTCRCTEVDEQNRQTELRQQRLARTTDDREEEEEVRRAIEAVEAAERREVEARRRREVLRAAELEAERAREAELLAQLEVERQQEEQRRETEKIDAECQLRNVLQLSLTEEHQAIVQTLQAIMDAQHILFDDKHGKLEQDCLSAWTATTTEQHERANMLQGNIDRNIERRKASLVAKHELQTAELEAHLEEEEDAMFMQIQMHLQGKPNSNTRKTKMQAVWQVSQKEERSKMEKKQKFELERLQASAQMEKEGVQRSIETKSTRSQRSHESRLRTITFKAGCERKWFSAVNQRRVEMVNEHVAIIFSDFEAGMEPTGLSEAAAAKISPLPAQEAQDCCELPDQNLVELESLEQASSPALIDKLNRKPIHNSRKDELSGMASMSAIGGETMNGTSLGTRSCSQPMPNSDPPPVPAQMSQLQKDIDRQTISTPVSEAKRRLTPLSPISLVTTPVLRHGDAFSSSKNGECSRPISLPVMQSCAAPTPPDSPALASDSNPAAVPYLVPRRPVSNAYLPRPHPSVSHQQSQTSLRANSVFGNGYSVPAALDPTLFSSRRNLATIPTQISDASNTSMKQEVPNVQGQQSTQPDYSVAISSGDKKSRSIRWPFSRKSPVEEEIREKTKSTVGDVF